MRRSGIEIALASFVRHEFLYIMTVELIVLHHFKTDFGHLVDKTGEDVQNV